MIVKTKHGDVYLGRIRILDLFNGDEVYFGSDLQAAIKAFDNYETETEGDWMSQITLFYYDSLTRHVVGYRRLNYSNLISLFEKHIVVE